MSAFRPGQLQALQELFTSGRLLCIQPTGRGKSLLYQLPSCIVPGIVLVISPLLALMRDQVDQLTHRFGISAGSLNSDQTEEENAAVRQIAVEGGLRILFVSPEQLEHVARFEFFLSLPLSLVVIDEAHCISTWGHDFRPGFRQIVHFVQAAEELHPDLFVLGLTATASGRVEEDIRKHLFSAKRPGRVLRESMDRPNLSLSTHLVRGMAAKLGLTEILLKGSSFLGKGAILIYCATRDHTELVASFLQTMGIKVFSYHAGFESDEKRRIQRALMHDECEVIVATNALGMGIDKPNIRLVIHFDVPGSITSYYQEVGRAGRDGLPASGILLYDPKDQEIQEHFIHSAVPASEDFDKVLALCGTSICDHQLSLTFMKQATGLHPTRVNIIAAELVEQGFLLKKSVQGKQVYCKIERDGQPDLSVYEVQREVKLRELAGIVQYASRPGGCRMRLLRVALGDMDALPCGRCDVCSASSSALPLNGKVDAIQHWLSEKPILIPVSRASGLSEGISLLDGRLRLPQFVRFMKERQEAVAPDPEILRLLRLHSNQLKVKAVIPLPSFTWKARDATARAIADWLQVPLFVDLLFWKTPPQQRQGNLLNNEQRKLNVDGLMQVSSSIPEGPLLLVDDYIGSGSTLREAARALRSQGGSGLQLIPFTIAIVKWHLGKRGFV